MRQKRSGVKDPPLPRRRRLRCSTHRRNPMWWRRGSSVCPPTAPFARDPRILRTTPRFRRSAVMCAVFPLARARTTLLRGQSPCLELPFPHVLRDRCCIAREYLEGPSRSAGTNLRHAICTRDTAGELTVTSHVLLAQFALIKITRSRGLDRFESNAARGHTLQQICSLSKEVRGVIGAMGVTPSQRGSPQLPLTRLRVKRCAPHVA